MNNKVILNIIIIYFVILCVVLGFQLTKQGNKIAAPSNSQEVTAEERLNNAIVICEGSPVMLVNKQQTLLDKTNSGLVPAIKGGVAYVPASFFKTAYDASVTEAHSGIEATVRMDGKALVLGADGNKLIDNSKEKNLSEEFHTYREDGSIYVPLSIFAEAFNKYLYYYDGMVIIADEKDAFGNEDTVFISGLRNQVDDLPYVANEQNLLEICDINTNDIFKMVGSVPAQEQKKNVYPVGLMENNNKTVQSDDNYIYRASENRVDIADYKNNAYVNSIELGNGFSPVNMYIKGDVIAVIGNLQITENVETTKAAETETLSDVQTEVSTETSTQAEQPSDTDEKKTHTVLKLFNIADKNNIVLLREFKMDGYYISDSQTGDYIYLLSRSAVIDNTKDGKFIPPSYTDSARDSADTPLSFDTMQYLPELGGRSYTLVAAINIADVAKEAQVKSYLCAGQKVYLSGSNLFIARNRYTCFKSEKKIENSHIYKINLSGGNIELENHTTVKGYIQDECCMNESVGYLQAVTNYQDDKGKDVQNIYIMNNNLEICGEANKVAEGGNIATSIFAGNKIYLVPEKAENPTYVVDISDPLRPVGNGTLRFSENTAMIYPYDEQHILVLDRSNEALKLCLVDINGEDEPKQVFAEELGKDNISSAAFDGSDIYFDNNKKILALPITIKTEDRVTFDGSYIYTVDIDEGFKRIGAGVNKVSDGFIRLGSNMYMFAKETFEVAPISDMMNISSIELNKSKQSEL